MSPPPLALLQIDALVHQFKGSSASFGAHTMAALCVQVRWGLLGGSQRPAVGQAASHLSLPTHASKLRARPVQPVASHSCSSRPLMPRIHPRRSCATHATRTTRRPASSWWRSCGTALACSRRAWSSSCSWSGSASS